MRRFLAPVALFPVLGSALFATPSRAQVDVLTQHNNIARTGLNDRETVLNTQNVSPAKFGKLFEVEIGPKCFSQPLVVSNLYIPKINKTINAVYLFGMTGQVFCIDGDDPTRTTAVWRRFIEGDRVFGNPTIDRASNTMFAVAQTRVNGESRHMIYAIDLLTGADKVPPKFIEGSVSGVGRNSVNGTLSFISKGQFQRPGLLILNGVVYAAFGGGVNEFDPNSIWHGWIFGYDAKTLALKTVFCVTPDTNGGGIWQSAMGLSSDGTSIYAVTGNGNGNPYSTTIHTGGKDYGNSVLKLTPDANGKLVVSSYFTPFNWKYIEDTDKDLGSTGALLVPGTKLVVTGDKMGELYVMDKDNLGGYNSGANLILQNFAGIKGHLHGSPAYYPSPNLGKLIYLWAEHDYLKAFRVNDNGLSLNPTPVSKSAFQVPPGMPGGFLSVSSNANRFGSGIVWANVPLVGDANKGTVPGVLRAFDAENLSRELYNSNILPGRDSSRYFQHFGTPTVANGKVYLVAFPAATASTGGKLLVYGLLPTATAPLAPTNLLATPAVNRIALSWSAVSGATTYQVERATSAAGPWKPIAGPQTDLSLTDWNVGEGARYFYRVVSANSGGEARSAPVSAQALFAAPGGILSLNLGQTTNSPSLATNQRAGRVRAPYWNNLAGLTGSAANLLQSNGTRGAASATCKGSALVNTPIETVSPDGRLMATSLSTAPGTTVEVQVANLPANFTSGGYDVLAYFDYPNPNDTRRLTVALGAQSQVITDSKNRDFEGEFFFPGIDDVGNTLLFANQTGASFTLSVRASDNTQRVSISGLQIVARGGAAASSVPVLVAYPSNNAISLSWSDSQSGRTYRLYRGQSATGPFTRLANSPTGTSYTDDRVQNGQKFFYYVEPLDGTGAPQVPSLLVEAMATSTNIGNVLSVDFAPTGVANLAPLEYAGSPGVPRPYWNNARGLSGTLGSLRLNSGATTTASVSWSAPLAQTLAGSSGSGSFLMMKGFLATNGPAYTVSVRGLPLDFEQNGYDVYLYSDGTTAQNAGAQFTISGASVPLTDPANTDFNGTYVFAPYGQGNFVKVFNRSTRDFTLTVTPQTAGGLAPLNGLQIVARKPYTAPNTPLQSAPGGSTLAATTASAPLATTAPVPSSGTPSAPNF